MDTPQQSSDDQAAMDQVTTKQNNEGFINKKWQKLAIYYVLFVGILSIGLWAGITKLGWFDNSVAISSSPTDSEIVSEMSKNLTEQLINDAIAYKNSNDNNRETALSILHQTADRRQEYIKALMKEDPDAFLRLAITPDIKDELLQEVNGIEATVTLEGKLEIIAQTEIFEDETENHHDHDHDHLNCTYSFFLVLPSGETKNLYLPESAPAYNPNDQIKVTGYELDDNIVPDTVADPDNFAVIAAAMEPGATVGTHATAVFLLNVEGSTIPSSFNKTNALQTFNEVNAWFQEASLGNFRLAGKLNPSQPADIFGTYTMVADNPDLIHCFRYNNWRGEAYAAAAADGFVAADYRHIMLIINFESRPGMVCGGGEGTMGGVGSSVGMQGNTLGSTDNKGTIIHELGHNLSYGLLHASSLYNCTINDQPVVFSKFDNCTYGEYGDPFSVMGSSQGNFHFNAIEKTHLGWIPAANVVTATTSGTYDLYPSDGFSSGTQLIRIPMTYDDPVPVAYGPAPWFYYLELRKLVGVQNGAGANAARKADLNGVFLRVGNSTTYPPKTVLHRLGALPGAEPCEQCVTGLRPGMVFKDPHDPNITIKVLSWTPDKATVSVEFGGAPPPACVRQNPTVIINPSERTMRVNPGSTVNHTVTVTNNDSPWGCSTSTFNITPGATNPAGLSFSPTSQSLTIAPGESKTQVFSTTLPPGMTEGSRTVFFTAINSDHTSYSSGSLHASIIVVNTGATPPAINISGITNGGTIQPNTNTKIITTSTHTTGISKVEIFINNKLVARCNEPKNGICDVFVKGSNTAVGTHMLRVVATTKDTSQTTGTANLTFNK